MNSPVERYLDAFAAYCKAETKVAEVAEMICTVADEMKENLPRFLRETYGLSRDPNDFPDPTSKKINMNRWPTAHQIEDLFRYWQEAWHRAVDAWDEVPDEYRLGLVELPDQMPDGINQLYYKIPDQKC